MNELDDFDYLSSLLADLPHVRQQRQGDHHVILYRNEPFVIASEEGIYVLYPVHAKVKHNDNVIELFAPKGLNSGESIKYWLKTDYQLRPQLLLSALKAYELAKTLYYRAIPILRHSGSRKQVQR